MNTNSTNEQNAVTSIWIDERLFEASNLREFTVGAPGEERRAFAFDFQVTHESYHDVTTLLYKGTFRVRIPSMGFEQDTDIYNYSTSLDNLYEEGAVGDYHLELAERR